MLDQKATLFMIPKCYRLTVSLDTALAENVCILSSLEIKHAYTFLTYKVCGIQMGHTFQCTSNLFMAHGSMPSA